MARAQRALRHALRHWRALQAPLREIDEWLLLLDYDGTLTAMAATPEQAALPASMRDVLRRAGRLDGVTVGIVSGRARRTVEHLVRVPGLVYVGNHGGEIQGRGYRFVHPRLRRSRPVLRAVASELRRALASVPGGRVEWKGLSLSVHWRQVGARHLTRFHRVVGQILRPWRAKRKIRVTRGKRVVEIRAPVAWDKGRSVQWLVRHHPRRLRVGVCYAGDDRTDEDAFRVVNRLNGISILVGRRRLPTAARWQLAGPGEVRLWLTRVCAARRARGATREGPIRGTG